MRTALAAGLALLTSVPADGQASGTVGVQVRILPRVLTVSVTSSMLDFAHQRADAGQVTLDPTTGTISAKAGGAHALGEIQLNGPVHAPYAVTVEHQPRIWHSGPSEHVSFALQWARSEGCEVPVYTAIASPQAAAGRLGDDGCAAIRFGGDLTIANAREGQYAGQLSVRIHPL